MLRNVRLTEELKARLDDLKAAQKRLVSAQDEERRRLERNIHDGAQQQLVALAVKLKLADGLIERDAQKARELVGQLQGETHAALEDLRDLARGIYPPLLADKGLVSPRSRRKAQEVGSAGRGPGRRDRSVPAGCRGGRLLLVPRGDAEHREVRRGVLGFRDDRRARRIRCASRSSDDGRGFDPAAATGGTGLQGIADRVGALDGQVTVTSSPGSGTTIEGRLPVPAGVRVDGVTGRARTKKPKGLRRVERWIVGLAMGVIAFVLEKAVMRSVKRGGGSMPAPEPTTITSKGAEADLD